MRCTFKTVFYVNGSKERDGIVPIMGRVTINGTIAQFSCKQSVTKAIWDAKGNRAIGKSKEAKEVNFALDNIKAQIAKHYQRLSDREAFVTAEMVRNAYQGIGTEYETLLRAFDKENAAFAKRVGKDRAKNTYNKYLVVRKYVAEFIKYQYKRSDMSMNELTEEFIRDYCLYLKNVNYFTNYHDNPYWWWGYPGYNWWYGYWGNWTGAWNGWYYPYPVVYSYSVGSLLVELVNLKAPLPKSADAKLPVLWTAYMTGLLSGSDKVNIELSTRAIEQAFVQSPYLKK